MYIYKFFKAIIWFFYKLTPKGKNQDILNKGFLGIKESNKKKRLTKTRIISSAKNLLKPKKIIAFHKGSSISKSKKSNHQVIKQINHDHESELKNNNLKISKTGRFQNA